MTKIDEFWSEWKRVIKDNGAIVMTASQPFTSKLVMSNLKDFKYEWAWNKKSTSGFVNAKNKPMNTIEGILIFSNGTCANKSKKRMKYFPQGLISYGKQTKRGNKQGKDNTYWRPSTSKNINFQEFTNYPRNYLEFPYEKGAIHPTQKPIKLWEYLIKTYTDEGDAVFDGFAGSMTTAIACDNLKRNWTCCETDKQYYELGLKRINENRKKLNSDLLCRFNLKIL